MKRNQNELWKEYKNFCIKNGLKENNFNSMKKWVEIGTIY